MFGALARKIFGSRNDRILKTMRKTVDQINAMEPELSAASDADLLAKSDALKARAVSGSSSEELLPEAFALAREAGKRVLNMRHFDVQLIGGMVLHEGKIAEMRTGEGKTLVGTLPVYLNALSGKGAHVVTVNDYLARRDAAWMGRLYHFLGMSTGVINSNAGPGVPNSFLFDPNYAGDEGGYPYLRPASRAEAYAADITYGTNNEYGFDYLRDNMAMSLEEKVQRDMHFAIVDEVDSILIDEARTPLIISGPAADTSELYAKVNVLMPNLVEAADEESEGDYLKDEKSKQVHMTESGLDKIEQLLVEQGILREDESLYDPSHIALLHHLNAALRAHAMFSRNVDYIVRDGEVVIVDEFTGRTMPGRRWSDGLHQAIEAKEGVAIQQENQTLASITFQNYFRLYDTLAGMTGTADTEAFEFQQIYGLEVVVIPTHRGMVRDDRADLVFLTQKEKYDAIVKDIEDCAKRSQPVLVGTVSIENSELISELLKKRKIQHKVLNAKHHESEAHIVSEAGRPGGVTIATNMAGRGTDIVLGGSLDDELLALGDKATEEKKAEIKAAWEIRHEQALKSGGLHIIGTERHESRRIDNQLRGRSGRQGDPGSSRFYLSLEDSLMRIFASERVSGLMQKLGMEEGEAIEHPWVTKAIENAQRKVEAHNYDIRKHLLEYDDVANDQRKVIYEQRNELMQSDDVKDIIAAMRTDAVDEVLAESIPPGSLDEMWDIPKASADLQEEFGIDLPLQQWLDDDDQLDEEGLKTKVLESLEKVYEEKEALTGEESLRRFEKFLLLNRLDEQWKEHLGSMDYLRQSVGLRGYAQKNPKQEYKRESFELFSSMLSQFKREVVGILSKVEVREPEVETPPPVTQQEVTYEHASAESVLADGGGAEEAVSDEQTPYVRDGRKIGRNEPCGCGSGKKFKHCHGKLA